MTTAKHYSIGRSKIVIDYHPAEHIRGWSFRIATFNLDIQMPEQYGYGSEADALEAGVLVIEELCKGQIRERERELAKLNELLQKAQAAQPAFGLSQADKQKWQSELNPITEITAATHPQIWQTLQPPV